MCLRVCSGVGGFSVGETPGPFPNPEAKPHSADGTALDRVWESRTPPTFFFGYECGLVAGVAPGYQTTLFFCASTPRPSLRWDTRLGAGGWLGAVVVLAARSVQRDKQDQQGENAQQRDIRNV
jgi:hypothetical protein